MFSRITVYSFNVLLVFAIRYTKQVPEASSLPIQRFEPLLNLILFDNLLDGREKEWEILEEMRTIVFTDRRGQAYSKISKASIT